MENILLREKKNGVEILTLNDPERLNVLSEEMLSLLQTTLDDISCSKDVKVVILKAAGKAYCAGHDLKQMQLAKNAKDSGRQYYSNLFKKCARLMMSIAKLPQPVIAEVDGIAAAAGCQLVATCDLAVCSTKASFGVNGINIGLFCSTPMVALSRNISQKKTFELLVTGDFLDSESARFHGLVNKVVSPEKLHQETILLAEKIQSKLSSVIKIGKIAFYKQREMDIANAYNYTGEVMADNMLFEDTSEGINAFIEKRPPDWTDN